MDYGKDVAPIRISAREAHQKSCERKYHLEALVDIYKLISKCVELGNVATRYQYENFQVADYVYQELLIQGYTLKLSPAEELGDVWDLEISWENVDMDPNKKYILPIPDTDNGYVCAYAFKHSDRWCIDYCNQRNAPRVTAKDLEEAPEWVKYLEVQEVED